MVRSLIENHSYFFFFFFFYSHLTSHLPTGMAGGNHYYNNILLNAGSEGMVRDSD